jgi:uncharacterized protein
VTVLLDSSVLVAAHISRAGVCSELLEDILLDHELVTSEFILEELARKLREKFHFPATLVAEVRKSIGQAAERVEPTEVPKGSCRDPEDLPILGSAVAGKVDLLITVDKDLLDLKSFSGIPIIKPGKFWKSTSP